MNLKTFGEKWVELATLKQKVAELEAELAPEILKKNEPMSFGGMKARISRGRGTHDYKDAFINWASEYADTEQGRTMVNEIVSKYTEVNYCAKMCEEASIPKEEIPYLASGKAPSVVFELAE